jgi:hypothetical protein
MRKLIVIVAALAAVVLLGSRPGQAYREGPWCALMMTGTGSIVERCDYWDLETCRLEVISGNRGFCNQNPRWPDYYASTSPKSKSKPSRKRTQR